MNGMWACRCTPNLRHPLSWEPVRRLVQMQTSRKRFPSDVEQRPRSRHVTHDCRCGTPAPTQICSTVTLRTTFEPLDTTGVDQLTPMVYGVLDLAKLR